MTALIVKASLGSSTVRRVSFTSVNSVYIELFQERIARCFSLQSGTFKVTYTDDDGDKISIHTGDDLAEAISYFAEEALADEGSEQRHDPSRHVLNQTNGNKVTLRVEVTVDYSGPSLSEPGSSESGILRSSSSSGQHVASPYDHTSHRRSTAPPRPPKPSSYATIRSGQGRSAGSGRRNGSGNGPPARMPGSAAPDYASHQSSSNGSSGESDELRELEWLRAQEERLTYFSRARDRNTVTTNSLAVKQGTRDNRGHGSSDVRLNIENPMGRSSDPNADDVSSDLPSFLSELRLSRQSAPSVLSSLPDELLRCCACNRALVGFRYVCCLCGPTSPDQALSDDGTQVVNSDGGNNIALSNVSSSVPSSLSPNETLSRQTKRTSEPSREIIDDPLGVNSNRMPSPQMNTTTDAREVAQHRYSDEDRDGFELCSDCIETEGVKHARIMSVRTRRAREQSAGDASNGIGQVELRHAFVELCRMGKSSVQQGWREVDYDDDVQCTTCDSGPIDRNRFKCLSCRSFELCLSCYRSVEEIHPAHAFLSIPDRPARPALYGVSYTGESSSLSRQASDRTQNEPRGALRHPDVLCSGCHGDIVGVRYSCAQCERFDLCARCEADDSDSQSDNDHTREHIMLKIRVPVDDGLVHGAHGVARDFARSARDLRESRSHRQSDAYRRGREEGHHNRQAWTHGARNHHSATSSWRWGPLPPPPPWHARGGPPPPFRPYYAPEPPMYYDDDHELVYGNEQASAISNDGRTLRHNVDCSNCRDAVVGIRWMCANCSSIPTYNLCSTCEKFAPAIHNPLHSFMRLTHQLREPLPPLSQFLPVIYDPSSPLIGSERRLHDASNGRANGGDNGEDDDVLSTLVLHQQVICDNCLESIHGPWMRCCHCPTSFDLCTDCLSKVYHEPAHIFLKLTRKVDLPLFREITQLSSSDPQPLLAYALYA